MIFLELIIMKEKKRYFIEVDETMKVGEFKKKLLKKIKINNARIQMIPGSENVPDDIPISGAGMWNGSGVLITDGSS